MNNLPVTAQLARLRRAEFSADIVNEEHIVPGVWLSWDSVEGHVTGNFHSCMGSLLDLSYVVHRRVRWVTLNIACNLPALYENDVIGLLCKAQTSKPFETMPFLRTGEGKGTGFIDNSVSEEFVIGSSLVTHIVFLKAASNPALCHNAAWRNLLIPLPTSSREVEFKDLRIIINRTVT